MPVTCCPIGHIYIDANGSYDDVGYGSGTISNPPGIAGCIRPIVNAAGLVIAGGPVLDPQDCPCCADNFSWSSYKQICMTRFTPYQTAEPIPCVVPCVCPDPVPFECEPCTANGTHIDFAFDFFARQCISCSVQDANIMGGDIDCFVPEPLLDPITSNFRLKNRNFI